MIWVFVLVAILVVEYQLWATMHSLNELHRTLEEHVKHQEGQP